MKRVILFLGTNLAIVLALKRLFMTHPPLAERIAAQAERECNDQSAYDALAKLTA